jgi:hypothetical protein
VLLNNITGTQTKIPSRVTVLSGVSTQSNLGLKLDTAFNSNQGMYYLPGGKIKHKTELKKVTKSWANSRLKHMALLKFNQNIRI